MFRTTEISNPRFESDHLRFITVKTPNLKGRGDICVFVPPLTGIEATSRTGPEAFANGGLVENLPLVTLLHGVYGSSWAWSQTGGAHRTALQMILDGEIPPMVLAMPSDGLWGDGSGYLPHDGKNFEKWIVDDVPMAVMEHIQTVGASSPRFISGLSMGGFGALRLGIKYAERYRAVSAHSSITDLQQMELFVEEPLAHYLQQDTSENSVWGMVQKSNGKVPPLRFDCGTEDRLIAHNRQLHEQLSAAQVEHIYEEFEGGHEWPYWQKHLRDTLRFFGEFV